MSCLVDVVLVMSTPRQVSVEIHSSVSGAALHTDSVPTVPQDCPGVRLPVSWALGLAGGLQLVGGAPNLGGDNPLLPFLFPVQHILRPGWRNTR